MRARIARPGHMAQPGCIQIDLHGQTVYQARVALDSALRRADASVYSIRVIHGYQGGDALKRLTAEYAAHPRVKALRADQSGCTELILRDRI